MTIDLAERDKLVSDWLVAKAASTAAVDAERDLRQRVVAMMFPEPIEGTNRYQLGNNYALKLQFNYSYDLGNKDIAIDGKKIPIADQVDELQDKIEKLGPEGALLASRLIRWKPELSVTEYKKLEDGVQAEIKALIDEILTVKPASPQLAFEEPK